MSENNKDMYVPPVVDDSSDPTAISPVVVAVLAAGIYVVAGTVAGVALVGAGEIALGVQVGAYTFNYVSPQG